MHLINQAARRSWLTEAYCSEPAFYIGLFIVWELLAALAALSLVPMVLTMAAASAPLVDPAPIVGL
jgi:hypothetical protein